MEMLCLVDGKNTHQWAILMKQWIESRKLLNRLLVEFRGNMRKCRLMQGGLANSTSICMQQAIF